MIRICSKCAALLLDESENCSFCDVPNAELAAKVEVRQAVTAGSASHDDIPEPEWRHEVSLRTAQFRARRGRGEPADSQSGLPFHEVRLEEPKEARKRPIPQPTQRQRQTERMEIHIQPELDFSAPDDRAHPQTALVPIAALGERRFAAALDAIFLGLTCAGFLGLFRSLGGQITFEKVDAAVYLIVLYLFYAQYFFLFTTFAGATPGMQLRSLTVVRLDGSLPDTKQLLWRSFGYLLSGATLLLGFVWSLWDEDRFTWQDRISHTYITAAAPLVDMGSLEIPAGRHRFAHK